MPATVTDASALAAVVSEEPAAEEVAAQLDAAERVIAPALIWFELANICWKKIRQHPDQRELLLDQFTEAAALPIEIQDVEHRPIIELGVETGLTAYDASYLWLARTLHAELVTLDNDLRAAARGEEK